MKKIIALVLVLCWIIIPAILVNVYAAQPRPPVFRPPMPPPHRPAPHYPRPHYHPRPHYPAPRYPHHHCLIATTIYGENDASVDILRNFRDKWLLTNSIGRGFVSYYEIYSPTVADFFNHHSFTKPLVKLLVMNQIVAISYLVTPE